MVFQVHAKLFFTSNVSSIASKTGWGAAFYLCLFCIYSIQKNKDKTQMMRSVKK